MALISMQNVAVTFGGPPVLDDVTLQIERNERICLLGANGTGKSTLLRVLDGELEPDAGDVIREKGVRVSSLAQAVPDLRTASVFETVARGLGPAGATLADSYRLSTTVERTGDADTAERLAGSQSLMSSQQLWPLQQRIERAIAQVSLDPAADVAALSGGTKRRVMLARALAVEPDLLLLDEPTNHLDIDAITWLEDFLRRFEGSVLFVTHDRTFLRHMATRIVELDRGRLTNWQCSYDRYLERKESLLEAEQKQWENFDRKLAQEEVWIRRGIKARRTRNEGRVRSLQHMREERRQRRQRQGMASFALHEAQRSGRLVIEARNATFGYGDEPLLHDVSLVVQRGDRVGIMGPNGSGKTTLLKLLLGEILPRAGHVRLGNHLQVAYADQLRRELDENKTIWENVAGDGDTVEINGKRRHVIGYLRDLLFSPEQAKTPVRALSGGERNRLMLARLFARPSNVLVFDEPTNDLDIETLELLEDLLDDYKGTILVVSHDRSFLNNVVTCTLAIEPGGVVREFVGGFDDWAARRTRNQDDTKATKRKTKTDTRTTASKPRRLSYKESRELEELPGRIEALEAERDRIYAAMGSPELYGNADEVRRQKERLETVEKTLEEAYERWEELDAVAER